MAETINAEIFALFLAEFVKRLSYLSETPSLGHFRFSGEKRSPTVQVLPLIKIKEVFHFHSLDYERQKEKKKKHQENHII